MATRKKKTPATRDLDVPELVIKRLKVEIVGETPLIVNCFSEEAIDKIQDKQGGKVATKRPPKVPEEEYQKCFYRWEDGEKVNDEGCYAFPVTAFKKSMRAAAVRFMDGVKGTEIAGAIRFDHIMAAIAGEPRMRRDMGRSGQTRDPRYRPEFLEWSTVLNIAFNSGAVSESLIVALLDQAGFGVGIGNWRPEKDGNHGTFRVGRISRIEVATPTMAVSK